MNRSGFSMVEMLVVVAIIALTMPMLFTAVFVILRQEVKVYALRTVKNEGDLILNNLKFNIKNYGLTLHSSYPATVANQICTTPSSTPATYNPLVLRDRDGNSFYYPVNSGIIASQSSVLAQSIPLNDTRVVVSGFTTSCNLSAAFSTPIITVSYTVTYNSPVAGSNTVSIPYQTKIKMRNQ